MATIQFDLVSPERKLASLEATEIHIPGSEGDFTAMADHAPLLTTLRPGMVKVVAGSVVTEYVVTGGFVEISGTTASVLAEHAIPKSEVTEDTINALVEAAEEAAKGTQGAEKDVADKCVADTKALLALI
ncbi:MAG: F0F1 ATP synthase subunit epsilon [Amylibacter sp.]|nr:F0F1 ATP synthase subunit epsilon [Amylibacter sp.]